MPANVDSMMSVRQIPWHGEGFILADWPGTWDEAWSAACGGHPWDVQVGDVAGPDGAPIPGWKRHYRSDNDYTLNIARDTWTAITNGELGQIVEGIMAHTDAAPQFDTAGALDEGRRVFVSILLGDNVHIPGDPSPLRKNLFVAAAHDGTASCKAGLTTVRVVCENTLKAAETDSRRTGHCYAFRHTKGWQQDAVKAQRIADAKAAIFHAHRQADEVIGLATELAAVPVTDAQIGRFLDRYYAVDEDASARKKENAAVRRGLLAELLEPEQVTLAGIRNTGWGLLNAVTEINDHMLPGKPGVSGEDAQRLAIDRMLLTPNGEKLRGLRLIRELAETSPVTVPVAAPRKRTRKAAPKAKAPVTA